MSEAHIVWRDSSSDKGKIATSSIVEGFKERCRAHAEALILSASTQMATQVQGGKEQAEGRQLTLEDSVTEFQNRTHQLQVTLGSAQRLVHDFLKSYQGSESLMGEFDSASGAILSFITTQKQRLSTPTQPQSILSLRDSMEISKLSSEMAGPIQTFVHIIASHSAGFSIALGRFNELIAIMNSYIDTANTRDMAGPDSMAEAQNLTDGENLTGGEKLKEADHQEMVELWEALNIMRSKAVAKFVCNLTRYCEAALTPEDERSI